MPEYDPVAVSDLLSSEALRERLKDAEGEKAKLVAALSVANDALANARAESDGIYATLTAEITRRDGTFEMLKGELDSARDAAQKAEDDGRAAVAAATAQADKDAKEAASTVLKLENELVFLRRYDLVQAENEAALQELMATLDKERQAYAAKLSTIEAATAAEREQYQHEYDARVRAVNKDVADAVDRLLSKTAKDALADNARYKEQLERQQEEAAKVNAYHAGLTTRGQTLATMLSLAETSEAELTHRVCAYQRLIKTLQARVATLEAEVAAAEDACARGDNEVGARDAELRRLRSEVDEYRAVFGKNHDLWRFLRKTLQPVLPRSSTGSEAAGEWASAGRMYDNNDAAVRAAQVALDHEVLHALAAVVRAFPSKFRFLRAHLPLPPHAHRAGQETASAAASSAGASRSSASSMLSTLLLPGAFGIAPRGPAAAAATGGPARERAVEAVVEVTDADADAFDDVSLLSNPDFDDSSRGQDTIPTTHSRSTGPPSPTTSTTKGPWKKGSSRPTGAALARAQSLSELSRHAQRALARSSGAAARLRRHAPAASPPPAPAPGSPAAAAAAAPMRSPPAPADPAALLQAVTISPPTSFSVSSLLGRLPNRAPVLVTDEPLTGTGTGTGTGSGGSGSGGSERKPPGNQAAAAAAATVVETHAAPRPLRRASEGSASTSAAAATHVAVQPLPLSAERLLPTPPSAVAWCEALVGGRLLSEVPRRGPGVPSAPRGAKLTPNQARSPPPADPTTTTNNNTPVAGPAKKGVAAPGRAVVSGAPAPAVHAPAPSSNASVASGASGASGATASTAASALRAAGQGSTAYVRYAPTSPAPAPLLASAFTGHKGAAAAAHAKPRVLKDVVSPVRRLSSTHERDGDGDRAEEGPPTPSTALDYPVVDSSSNNSSSNSSGGGGQIDLTMQMPYALGGAVPLPAADDARFMVAYGTGLGLGTGMGMGAGAGAGGAQRDIATEAARREAALVSSWSNTDLKALDDDDDDDYDDEVAEEGDVGETSKAHGDGADAHSVLSGLDV